MSGLSSMTGYGSAAASLKGWQVRVECRSVNHKRLSCRISTPDELRWLEPNIMARIKEVLSRGRIEVRLDVEPGTGDERAVFDMIDDRRFSAVAEKLKRLAVDHRLVAPVSLEAVWEYREFFDRSQGDLFGEDDEEALLQVFEIALDELAESRAAEGIGIQRDLSDYLDRLAAHLDAVDAIKDEADRSQRCRVHSRLRQALDDFESDAIDEDRLNQELAYYVEKGDISEELQRARSHVAKLAEVIAESGGEVGKKVDFYLQELIRESNTMGSKSQHAKLTDLVIDMKSIIEKMREQAANVE